MTAAESPAPGPKVLAPHRRRRALAWTAIIAALVIAGIALALVPTDEWRDKGPLDPEHPGPEGGMALAEILRGSGAEVDIVRSLDDAVGADVLAVTDTAPLSDEALADLIGSAGRTVLLDPGARDARVAFGDGDTLYAGVGDGPSSPRCAVGQARTAGPIAPGEVWRPGTAERACYPSGDGFGLLAGTVAGADAVLIDGTALFDNANLASGGNASLAMGLLAGDTVTWYVPSAGDADPNAAPPTLGELTPRWVSPAIVLLAFAAVAAGVWRGRRFGPLVAETLPVTVRGSETLEGRARLYQRSGDARHAAGLLRRGAVRRMAKRLGLSDAAPLEDVADAAAARLGARRADVAAVLLSDPATDQDLAAFGASIRDLEAAVDAAVTTERKTP
ncbi:DUF4350 domain-containing protein [Microbacterium halophytorum]|uniref:DUF4350 domain-containing protein n=1 Tax=Microbacterium halophytorum TaxID=2067568 RepID=UPI001E3DF429|nr:DUF4350 domain-containing protein [Microbacterium halophytorum]